MTTRHISGPAGLLALTMAAVLAACSSQNLPPDEAAELSEPVPLTDMGTATYFGMDGGLYGGGSNALPADHQQEGMERAAGIRPLSADGAPDPSGKIVVLSVGMSNTTQAFCGGGADGLNCQPFSFMGQAHADPTLAHDVIVFVDGAQGGRPAEAWVRPDLATYETVRTQHLPARGVTEAQVQVVWVKQANPRPTRSLPDPEADAHELAASLGSILRALQVRYPNLQQVFLSSRTYGGYAATALNPEPFAFESGFAVRRTIQAQIEQRRSGAMDPRAGDLSEGAAPWAAWGPYLWANGADPRSDGLFWLPEDFVNDGTHPSASGREKVGRLLLEFFRTAPHTRCWLVTGESCAP